jgi:hypothetical protein
LSDTLDTVRRLVEEGNVRISDHGYDELAADNIFATDVLAGVASAQLVEDYPEYGKGPSVLVLQKDAQDQPIHVVWGISKGRTEPAVLVTAYRPDPNLWENDFVRRRL